MKIFISQPMKHNAKEEILADRERIEAKCRAKFGEDVEFIDSFFRDYSEDMNSTEDYNRRSIKYLAEALKLLADADVAVFGNDWAYSTGCNIEFDVAEKYCIPTIDEMTEL